MPCTRLSTDVTAGPPCSAPASVPASAEGWPASAPAGGSKALGTEASTRTWGFAPSIFSRISLVTPLYTLITMTSAATPIATPMTDMSEIIEMKVRLFRDVR